MFVAGAMFVTGAVGVLDMTGAVGVLIISLAGGGLGCLGIHVLGFGTVSLLVNALYKSLLNFVVKFCYIFRFIF